MKNIFNVPQTDADGCRVPYAAIPCHLKFFAAIEMPQYV